MTESESLLRAVLESPADDAPRLVYADWLEEHDRPEQAELIRHMIHFPRDRAVHGPPRPASAFWPDAPPWVRYAVRRGFVCELMTLARRFLESAGDWFRVHPITRVVLLDRCPGVRAGGGAFYARIRAGLVVDLHTWPHELFAHLEDGAELHFQSRERGLLALSAAAVDFGRRAAGLPALDRPAGVDQLRGVDAGPESLGAGRG